MATVNPVVQKTQDSTSKREELSPRDALSARIASYANLEPGFNGHDEYVPKQADVDNARSFVGIIPEKGLGTVKTMVICDGEIDFEWRGENLHLEVGFIDGKISFSGDMPHSGEEIDGEGPYTGTLPPELLRLMDAIF